MSDAVCHQHVAARWKRWTVNNSWQHESIGAAGDKQATGYSIGNRQTRQLLFEWIGCVDVRIVMILTPSHTGMNFLSAVLVDSRARHNLNTFAEEAEDACQQAH